MGTIKQVLKNIFTKKVKIVKLKTGITTQIKNGVITVI